MIGETISFVLRNLPAILLLLALMAAVVHRPASAENFLAWICLLLIGLSGIWAAFFHLIMPQVAAKMIGWEVSPFQFEVGVADLAIGVAGFIAFWRPLEFKAAVVTVASIFLFGDAFGHVRQMIVAGNFAPGNAGVPFFTDVLGPLISIALLFAAGRKQGSAGLARGRT